MSAFQGHLDTGVTTLARCWAVIRRDGSVFGFTDHDGSLDFDGITFKADSGMTARAVMSGTGLSVDNSEAMGALSDGAITEADIEAGRYDGAEVKAWLVNWADVEQRELQFAGTIGELRREGGAFHAELRGLTELLNQPHGRVYQKTCSAILGDSACAFDLEAAGYAVEVEIEAVEAGRKFVFAEQSQFDSGFFERGRVTVMSGAAEGLVGVIKRDANGDSGRQVEIWQAFRAEVEVGDRIKIEAGCDKRSATCKAKFNNFLNFQGFPDIPGDDWLTSTPSSGGENLGLSLRQSS